MRLDASPSISAWTGPAAPLAAPAHPAPVLPLDGASLDPTQLSMPTLTRELTLQRRPALLLRIMMDALEGRRQAQKLGWSRPWNKVGLTVFRSHRGDLAADGALYSALREALQQVLAEADAETLAFIDGLLDDPTCMAFVFFHNRSEGGRSWEGLTLSLGRKVPGDTRRRDRLDVILEDERRADGTVDGRIDQVRIHSCPWSQYREGADRSWTLTPTADGAWATLEAVYRLAVAGYHADKAVEERQWDHWAQRFISYFGPRRFIPIGSAFT